MYGQYVRKVNFEIMIQEKLVGYKREICVFMIYVKVFCQMLFKQMGDYACPAWVDGYRELVKKKVTILHTSIM